jgi:hypothetical protein
MSKISDSTTLWIVTRDAHATSYRVHRGPRTVAALKAAIAADRHLGAVHLEFETPRAAAVVLTLAELCALGVVEGEADDVDEAEPEAVVERIGALNLQLRLVAKGGR